MHFKIDFVIIKSADGTIVRLNFVFKSNFPTIVLTIYLPSAFMFSYRISKNSPGVISGLFFAVKSPIIAKKLGFFAELWYNMGIRLVLRPEYAICYVSYSIIMRELSAKQVL